VLWNDGREKKRGDPESAECSKRKRRGWQFLPKNKGRTVGETKKGRDCAGIQPSTPQLEAKHKEDKGRPNKKQKRTALLESGEKRKWGETDVSAGAV